MLLEPEIYQPMGSIKIHGSWQDSSVLVHKPGDLNSISKAQGGRRELTFLKVSSGLHMGAVVMCPTLHQHTLIIIKMKIQKKKKENANGRPQDSRNWSRQTLCSEKP